VTKRYKKKKKNRKKKTMATLAEQNAVRCKEAGNVLYKSERYEEVSSEEQNASCVFFFFDVVVVVFAFASCISFVDADDFFQKCEKRLRAFTYDKRSLSLSLSCYALTRAFINNNATTNRPSKNTPNLFRSTARTRRRTPTAQPHISRSKTSPRRSWMRKRAPKWTKRGRKGTIEKRNVYAR